MITILVITSKNGAFFGWNRIELLFLIAGFNVFIGLFHAIFSSNFQNLATSISSGRFDSLLLRPLNSQFSASLWMFNFSSLLRIMFGVLIIVGLILKFDIQIHLINVIYFIPLFIFGMILLYCIWLIFVTALFWIPELHNMVDLLYTMNGYVRYPTEMFRALSVTVLVIAAPLALTVTVPFRFLIGKISYSEAGVLILLSIVLFVISRSVWNFALRSYTSASN